MMMMMMTFIVPTYSLKVKLALSFDVHTGDLTTEQLLPEIESLDSEF